MTAPNKIDSNIVGLSFAEEASLKTLPGSPVWYELEPNSYGDFGTSMQMVARTPINASRQRAKGTVTGFDVSAAFNMDFTQNNLTRLLQSFFFAAAREKPSTKKLNSAAIPVTGVSGGTTDKYTAASGLDSFLVNHIILASGFTSANNNGLKIVDEAAADYVGITGDLDDEVSPPAAAKLEAVGYQFPSGDLSATASAGNLRLTSASITMTTLGLTVGEWVFIGGDAAGLKFATCPSGYARVKAIAATYIDFDLATFVAATDAGTDKTVQMFFGTVLRNESESNLITTRPIQLERSLGNDGSGTQAEYITGAIANEFTINIPQEDKINVDLSFVGMNSEYNAGATGLKAGTRITALGEEAFNTSSTIYRMLMNIVDSTTLNPTPFFAYVQEGNISINNNVSGNKAIGVVGSFDANVGDFEVSGSLTAYFSTLSAVAAIKANSDIAFNIIGANANAGFVMDIPLLALGSDGANVEKDNAVTLNLDMAAARCPAGYTLLMVFFKYLPTLAMPA